MRKKKTCYPLTRDQRCMLFCFFALKHDAMFIRRLFSVSGECDVSALQKAFLHLVETQDALRLRLHFGWRGFSQYAADAESFSVPVIALRDKSELDAAVQERYGMLKNPLFGGPFCCAVIFTYNGGASLFMIFNHLCFDGYSSTLAVKLLKEYYLAYANGEVPPAQRSRYTYEAYCAECREEDRRYDASGDKAEDLAYWRALFREKPYVDKLLPTVSFREFCSPYGEFRTFIDGALYGSMVEFCRSRGVSVPYFLAATAALVVKCLTGKEKILFTASLHGRSTAAQKRMIGMMSKSFPAIFDLSDAQTLADYYVSGYLSYLEGMKHSRDIVYQILRDAGMTRDRNGERPNVDDVYFGAWEADPEERDSVFSSESLLPSCGLSRLYLIFYDDHTDKALVSVRYQTGGYSEERVSQLVEMHRAIVASVVSHPEQTVAELVRGIAAGEAQEVPRESTAAF